MPSIFSNEHLWIFPFVLSFLASAMAFSWAALASAAPCFSSASPEVFHASEPVMFPIVYSILINSGPLQTDLNEIIPILLHPVAE